MDITTISHAQASLKAMLGLARGAASAAVDHQIKDRLIEIQQAILDVQGKLADAQEERLSLLHQVAQLRDKLRAVDAAKAALDGYVLCEIAAGLFLYRSRDDVGHSAPHHACPTCHNAGKVAVLQAKKSGRQQTHYVCTTCKFSLYVGPSDPMPPLRPARIGSTDRW